MKQLLANHIKNILGWKTKRKLLAFAVDDYGNVRLASKNAKQKLLNNGVKLKGRFDNFDSLDTREDFERLFDVLDSVKDAKGNPAIFTSYAMSCNIDFEKSIEQRVYVPERLDDTYAKISSDENAYEKGFELIKLGIKEKFLRPQFHGREHINVNLFNKLLSEDNKMLLANLHLQSLAGVPGHPDYPNVNFNQAFSFWKQTELALHKEIIRDGLSQFKELYGYESETFTPPAMQLHPDLNQFVSSLGIKGINKNRRDLIHIGEGSFVNEKNVSGDKVTPTTVKIVRNCVFEPNDRNIDWVNYTFKQIQAAFFWNKPAIVSSHRVNFCGHIDESNRKIGLEALQLLLEKVILNFPDVEFVGLDEITLEILNENGYTYL
jgi:hypothetical protein